MTFANLEKYVHSKKCLKQRRQPLPPPPPKKTQKNPSSKVEGILLRKLKVVWLTFDYLLE